MVGEKPAPRNTRSAMPQTRFRFESIRESNNTFAVGIRRIDN